MATDYEVTHAKSIQEKKDKARQKKIRKMATEIFKELRDCGAAIANTSSILIIEDVLNKYITH